MKQLVCCSILHTKGSGAAIHKSPSKLHVVPVKLQLWLEAGPDRGLQPEITVQFCLVILTSSH